MITTLNIASAILLWCIYDKVKIRRGEIALEIIDEAELGIQPAKSWLSEYSFRSALVGALLTVASINNAFIGLIFGALTSPLFSWTKRRLLARDRSTNEPMEYAVGLIIPVGVGCLIITSLLGLAILRETSGFAQFNNFIERNEIGTICFALAVVWRIVIWEKTNRGPDALTSDMQRDSEEETSGAPRHSGSDWVNETISTTATGCLGCAIPLVMLFFVAGFGLAALKLALWGWSLIF